MPDAIPFDREPPASTGQPVALANGVQRLIAPNPGPFTFTGTCTYLVGEREVAVIDPGPDDEAHRAALLAALAGRRLSAILVTHTHRDHSPGARPLAALTGAPIYGAGPHRFARPPHDDERDGADASADLGFVPDIALGDGHSVSGSGWRLTALETPGHCANHLAFTLEGAGLFSGDHVMAWSTTVVAPPDGSIGDYMRSLEKLAAMPHPVFWPGHGGVVAEPERFVRALIGHRRMREAAILQSLRDGAQTIGEVVSRVYAGLDPRLVGAASLNTLAHLEDLTERALVETEGPPSLRNRFRAL